MCQQLDCLFGTANRTNDLLILAYIEGQVMSRQEK